MPVPTHGPFCQTLIHLTSCWYFQQSIFVLQCSRGSAVLLDHKGAPWPKHLCTGSSSSGGGIDGSGFSGWTAVDVLRARGAAITTDVMAKIFSCKKGRNYKTQQGDMTRKVEPDGDGKLSLLAVVRQMNINTKRAKDVSALPVLGRKLLGLDPALCYRQITLVDNTVRPNESYTVIIADHLTRSFRIGLTVMTEMHGDVAGGFSIMDC